MHIIAFTLEKIKIIYTTNLNIIYIRINIQSNYNLYSYLYINPYI